MKNVAASVRARLGKQSKAEGQTLDFLIERFAIGRLFWRLSRSQYAKLFVLKGAQLFCLWENNPHRPTRDIDFLGFGDSSPEAVKAVFTEIFSASADPDDGLEWGRPTASPIRDDQRYGGVRVTVQVSLAGARVQIQIDVGFGDAITPKAEEHRWRDLLGYPEARLLTYPPETVIAEKLEAAVQLDINNSRMKDFYDLDWLGRYREFDFATLCEAIRNTFERRGTTLPREPPFALTQEFATDSTKQVQWKAFLRKNKLDGTSLEDLITRLSLFLLPVLTEKDRHLAWHPDSGWTDQESSGPTTSAP
jgi:hypothetical protein